MIMRGVVLMALVISGLFVPPAQAGVVLSTARTQVEASSAQVGSGMATATTKGQLTIAVATTSPKAGKKFAVSGQASAGKAGWKVRIQARKVGKSAWTSIGSTRTKMAGKFSTRVKLGIGAWEVRAKALVTRGPVSDSVQVTPLGRVRKVKVRKSTVVVPARDVAQVGTIAADGSQPVTFASGRSLPRVGAVVTMNASASVPEGVLGRVETVDVASRTVVLRPAALSEAYSTYRVTTVASLGDLAVAAAGLDPQVRAQALMAVSQVAFKCEGVVTSPLTSATVDMSQVRASFDFDMGQRFMSLLLVGNPKFGLGFKLGAAQKATCGAQMVVAQIPLGASGLFLTITPQISLSVGAEGAAEFALNAEGRFALGFAKSRNQPVVYTKALKLTGGPSVGLAAKVSTELSAGLEVGILVGGRAGVYGEAGPALLGELTVRDGPQECVWMGAALNFGLGIKVDLFIVDWKWELGSLQWKMPTIYDACLTSRTPVNPPPTPGPPPPAPPTNPPAGLTVYRTSGPAGFGSTVSGVECPRPTGSNLMIVSFVTPEGGIYGGTSPLTGLVGQGIVDTDVSRSPGVWRYQLPCLEVTDTSWDAQQSGFVRASYEFPVTVTGPSLKMSTDVVQAVPGQVVRVSDGGGCGDGTWDHASLYLSSSDNSVNQGGSQLVSQVPLSSAGRWGPASITLPTTPLAPGSHYVIYAKCESTMGHSWIAYNYAEIAAI